MNFFGYPLKRKLFNKIFSFLRLENELYTLRIKNKDIIFAILEGKVVVEYMFTVFYANDALQPSSIRLSSEFDNIDDPAILEFLQCKEFEKELEEKFGKYMLML